MVKIVLLFILGLVLIVKGGDWFVDSATWIAKASGIPSFIIGATVVSFATTLPELTVSITGVLDGEVDLAVGNAVGSVTANLGLIMGISIACLPMVLKKGQITLKGILMLAAAVFTAVFCLDGGFAAWEGIVLLAIFAYFMFENVRDAIKTRGSDQDNEPVDKKDLPKELIFFAVGIACIILGSNLLIDYGSALALELGVPAAIIGVTMVAIGTSLPELVTTITSLVKKNASMSIGNILGANIIDLTLIMPVCSFLSKGNLPIANQTLQLDAPVCLGIGLIALLPPLISNKFHRWQGVLMLIVYAAYVVVLVRFFGV